MIESEFLDRLIGKAVRITVADEGCLPPMRVLVLREVSTLGIVASDSRTQHFFPWHEIVEVHQAEEATAILGCR